MRRLLWLVAAVAAAGPALGCGGGGERGKNHDLDRPRPVDTRR